MRFHDRSQAGAQLAAELSHLAGERPYVLALPRGGVPVAYEVARALGAPLDVLAVRKLGAPWHPELGLGALAENGVAFLDEGTMAAAGVSTDDLRETIREERLELARRVERYRGGRPLPDLSGRTVIVVDDGVAMGVTMRAAVAALRGRCARVVVAVPVGAPETLAALRAEADEVIAVIEPDRLFAIGWWYDLFEQTSDEEVLRLLEAARADVPVASAILRVPGGEGAMLDADLDLPASPRGLVVFAHGSGSSRLSPRNRHVAQRLREAGLATVLLDLLTPAEAERDAVTAELRFDFAFLGRRLATAVDWLWRRHDLAGLRLGLFGASTGAAAALIAAAIVPDRVAAIVSRGGRPDLAAPILDRVGAPALFLVGSFDEDVLALHRRVLPALAGEQRLEVIHGAGHLFEEPGRLDEVARRAAAWFTRYLMPAQISAQP